VSLDVEASVDLDVLGVEADFDIGLKLGAVEKELTGVRKQLAALSYMPIASSLTASGPANAAGTALLKIGRPSHGRMWNITRVSVLGADDQTVLAGSKVAVYVGSSVSPNLSDVLDPAAAADTVPFIIYWNKDQVFVTDNDDLFVIVYGAGANQLLVANATVLDYNKAGRWEGP
jgi:hypothetical protein